jgi:hypothetical protein
MLYNTLHPSTMLYQLIKLWGKQIGEQQTPGLGTESMLSNFSTLWTWTTPTNHDWFGTVKGQLLMAILINALWQ